MATKPAQEMAGSEDMKWREERWRRRDSRHSFSLDYFNKEEREGGEEEPMDQYKLKVTFNPN